MAKPEIPKLTYLVRGEFSDHPFSNMEVFVGMFVAIPALQCGVGYLLAAVIAPEFWTRLGAVSLLGGRVGTLLEHAPGMLPYWFASVVLLLPQNLFLLGVSLRRYQPKPIDLAAMKHFLDHRAVSVFFGTGLWILTVWWCFFSSLRDQDGDLISRSDYFLFLPSWLLFSSFLGTLLVGGLWILQPLFKKPARDHA